MSEGIVPFVSSSPPPFDDNFEFDDDEDDLYGRPNSGYFINESPVQEAENGTNEISEIASHCIKSDSMTFIKEKDEFDNFMDYQTVTVSSKINDEVMLRETSGVLKESQICGEVSTMADLNNSDDGNMEKQIKQDEFDDFEEFVFHASTVESQDDTKAYEENELSTNQRVDAESQIKFQPSSQMDDNTFADEVQNDSVNLKTTFCNLDQIKTNDDDDDDDFSGFEGADKIEEPINKISDNFKEESWACFEAFEGASISDEQIKTSETKIQHPKDCDGDDDDDDDDFGGFEEAIEIRPKITEISYDVSEVLNQTFNTQPITINRRIATLAHLIGAKNENSHCEENVKCSRIWKNLESIERTPALKMQWKTSSLLQSFLKTINISQQAKTSSHSNIPAFASNLGLLEPTKLKDGQSDAKDQPYTPLSDIPKVEFDWANSVLTDPLDIGNVCHLDLDFFGDEVFSSCMSPACKKERELLDSLEPSHNDPRKSLNSLLANVPSNNVTLIKNSVDLSVSPRLQIILDKIPDLSFMQSKVLMFPMREEFIGTAETFS